MIFGLDLAPSTLVLILMGVVLILAIAFYALSRASARRGEVDGTYLAPLAFICLVIVLVALGSVAVRMVLG